MITMELKAKYSGGHTQAVLCVCANNNQFASGSESNELCLWDLEGQIIHKAQSASTPGGAAHHNIIPEGDVTSVCFSVSQPHNLYCAVDSTICLYDTRCMDSVITKFNYNKDDINQLSLHPKDNFLAACDDSGHVRIIDVHQRKLFKTLRKHTNICSSVSFHPRLPWHLASGGLDSNIFTWDFSRGRVFSSLNTQELNPEAASSAEAYTVNPPLVHSISYSSTGVLLACGLENSTVHILDFPKRNEVRVKRTLQGHKQGVSQVCFCGDDVLSAGNDGKIIRWNIQGDSTDDKHCTCTDTRGGKTDGCTCTLKGETLRETESQTESDKKCSDVRHNIVNHGDKINWICPAQSKDQSLLLVADQSAVVSVYKTLVLS